MPQPWSDESVVPAADIAACRAMLRTGSRTFFAASLLLPRAVREPASALYAFCRLADDLIDLEGGRGDAIGALNDRLDRAYAGCPLPFPADRALAGVVAQFGIPRTLPAALIEGFEWDAQGRRYDDLASLHAYAARVAGSVGAMMAMLMGVRAPDAVARACHLCVAMQRSNIARDVGEDARAGRIYLPCDWLREAGIDPDAWLARPAFTDALGTVVARLLHAADDAYARVEAGIARLPAACRPGIRAAQMLYTEIGREVARRGFDSVSARAVVSGRRKATLLLRAGVAAVPRVRERSSAAVAECNYLVEAVAAAPPRLAVRLPQRAAPRRNLGERVDWVIDLFERLERRERAQRSAAGFRPG